MPALRRFLSMLELQEFLKLLWELEVPIVEGTLCGRLFLAVGEDSSIELPASIAEDGPCLLLDGRALLRVLTELWILVIAVAIDLVEDLRECLSVAEDSVS